MGPVATGDRVAFRGGGVVEAGVAALLAALSCLPAAADDAIIFNPSTHLIDVRLVLAPTPDMIVWDGGIATRAGSVWVGDGWGRYPGGRGALTTRMLRRAE